MSRVISTEYFCDLSPHNTVPAVEPDLQIGFRGVWYSVDVGEDALKSITDLMDAVKANGRKDQPGASRAKPVYGTAKQLVTAHNLRVREWARANGWPELAERGQIPHKAISAYNEAHPDDKAE